MHTAWQVEQDPYCLAVLAKHFPDADRYEDVREVGAHNLAPVDLICGGFPCQDLSVAGKGAGIDGERSGLWAEFARIIGELRPRYVVVENVPALTRNEWLGRVLGDLAACGFDAEWDCLPASAFGAPHRRDRIWLVAYPQGGDEPDQPRVDHERGALVGAGVGAGSRTERGHSAAGGRVTRGDQEPGGACALAYSEGDGCGQGGQGRPAPNGEGQRESERALQDPDSSTLQPWRVGGRIAQAGGSEWWAVEPPVCRVAHGVPNRLGQLAALGNALVPQIAEWIGRRILDYEKGCVTR